MPWILVWKNLWDHKIRTLLTLGALTIAVFLIVFLTTLVQSLQAGVQASSAGRLIVQSAVSLFVELPVNYRAKIETVDGVANACKMQWFGGYYQEQSNFFAQFAIDRDRFFDTYPEVELIEGSKEAFQASRTACLIGQDLAERFGFGIGDRVPIIGTIFARKDGKPWDFEVAGIYRSKTANVDNQTLWFRFDYLDEVLEAGAAGGPRGTGVVVVTAAPGADTIDVMSKVDKLFWNGPQRVQTTTEAEFQRQFVSMLGSVPTFLTSIGGGVLFAILLAVLNTMLMSARQRTREFGVLKALGFTDQTTAALLIAEGLLIAGLGGLAGTALAVGSSQAVAKALRTIVPFFVISGDTIALALGLSLVLGAAASALPAWQTSRLDPLSALRSED